MLRPIFQVSSLSTAPVLARSASVARIAVSPCVNPPVFDADRRPAEDDVQAQLMRHVGSHVASDGALAQLAAEVHGLATRFERATQENSSNELLHRLESRIAALAESGRSVHPISNTPCIRSASGLTGCR
jgi:hypothetical protein